ncbi:ABC transporter substrate-binding protein [Roseomonas sp. 18066]|uniref:ABC transporter substrate-binding protein n=1 Tax=Roseomonas sp. 18066 TaxID=2681412 RepID=UPI00135A2992|nr:ABC transporter substrate-binding protein [Roseomonas sp. 18066]
MATTDGAADRGRLGRRQIGLAVAAGWLTGHAGAATAQSGRQAAPAGGGTLRVYADAFSVDPRLAWTVGANALADSLIDRDPTTLEFTPWLAESWEVDGDATAFTFTLRENITFSNGDPLDAAAVKANFDGAVADLKAGGGWYIRGVFDHYLGTEVIDARRFTVRFSAGNAPFLANVSTSQLAIIHPGDFAKTLDERRNFGVIGSGPFVVGAVKPRVSLRLVRRADYAWPSRLARRQGPAGLEAIEIVVVPEAGVREGALRSGEAGLILRPTPEGVTRLPKDEIEVSWRQQTGIGKSLNVNLRAEKLRQLELRQAVLKAIDRRELAELVSGPASRPAGSILASATYGYHDFSDTLLAYDPEGARALLEKIGWVAGGGRFRRRQGRTLSLSLVWDDSHTTEEFVTLIKDQLARVGIDLSLTFRKITQASAEFREGRYDFWYQNGTRADPDVLRKTYSNAGVALDANVRYVDSAEITGSGELEALLQRSNLVPDSPERLEILRRAQEILLQYAIRIPVEDNPQIVIAAARQVGGLRFSPLGEPVFADVALRR